MSSFPRWCSLLPVVLSSTTALVLVESLAGSAAHAGPLVEPVVGGFPVQDGAWPDVAAVLMADGGSCTGTLLAADLVLTAAHCVEAGPQKVVLGSIDLASPDGQWRDVKWARAYPGWLDRYDVGVIMLEHPVAAPPRAIAEGCSSTRQLAPGAALDVVGFGLTTPSAVDANTRLHQARISVVDGTCTGDPSCNPDIAPDGEFTAGGAGADACFGDSGGPVYVKTASGPALVGVVSRGLLSFAEPCGGGGVFVRADAVAAWIQSVTGRVLKRAPCDAPDDDGGRDTGQGSADARGTEDDGRSAGGCAAAGGAQGLLACALVLVYGLGCAATLRAARLRRRRPRAQVAATRWAGRSSGLERPDHST